MEKRVKEQWKPRMDTLGLYAHSALVYLKRIGERISLPVEELVWNQISNKPDVERVLREDLGIVIVGTDPDLTFPRLISKSCPNPITVIERDHEIAYSAALTAIENDLNTSILERDFFQLVQSDLEPNETRPDDNVVKPGLVIGKHIGLFMNMAEFVKQACMLMPDGGLVVVSNPIGVSRLKTDKELEKHEDDLKSLGITWTKERIDTHDPRKMGTIFTFTIPPYI